MERQHDECKITLEPEDTPFLPPGSVTPGPGLAQECSRCSQQHLSYFSAHTQAHYVHCIRQSNHTLLCKYMPNNLPS